MADPAMVKEFPKVEQRYAVAMSLWKKKQK